LNKYGANFKLNLSTYLYDIINRVNSKTVSQGRGYESSVSADVKDSKGRDLSIGAFLELNGNDVFALGVFWGKHFDIFSKDIN
jgi:hypothetical protein